MSACSEFDRVASAFRRSLSQLPNSDAAHLPFRVTGVDRIENESLTRQFDESMRHFQEKGYNPPDRSAILTAYHGTRQSNIESIVQHNLSVERKGQIDEGWRGAGLYFSQHAD